jgi:hypothetical protein
VAEEKNKPRMGSLENTTLKGLNIETAESIK